MINYSSLSHAFCYVLSQKLLLPDYCKRELTYSDFIFTLIQVESEGSDSDTPRREAAARLSYYSQWLSLFNGDGFDFSDGTRRREGICQREYHEGNST